MAKQKVKSIAKISGDAADGPASVDAVPAVIAPGKNRGKHKARLRTESLRPGKSGAVKRTGKGKLKALGKRVAPKAAAEGAAAQPAGASLLGQVVERLVRRTTPHKIGRRAVRLPPLERLEFAVDEVRHGARVSPRTRKLQLSGVPKMAQKVVEEAAELAIEAVLGNRAALINESVDLLYNLVVLLAEAGVPLSAIWAEMERREVSIGMAEKLPKAVDAEG